MGQNRAGESTALAPMRLGAAAALALDGGCTAACTPQAVPSARVSISKNYRNFQWQKLWAYAAVAKVSGVFYGEGCRDLSAPVSPPGGEAMNKGILLGAKQSKPG